MASLHRDNTPNHNVDYWIGAYQRTSQGAEEKDVWRNLSVCQLQALNVRTDQWCTVTLIEKSEDRLILDWTHSTDCQVEKTFDFDFSNSFWKNDEHIR